VRVMKLIGAAAIVILISAPAIAQESPAQSIPTIGQVPIAHTRSDSGKDMFLSYCDHGKDAKGNGPAATAMKTPPADLTILAHDNGGKYPASHVAAVIRGQATLASHGKRGLQAKSRGRFYLPADARQVAIGLTINPDCSVAYCPLGQVASDFGTLVSTEITDL
jgi:hypothetical protein